MTLAPPPAAPPRIPLPAHPGRAASVRASSGKRAGAFLIDFAIVAVTGVLVWVFSGSLPLVIVAVIELWAIGWIWEGHTGGTPGNLICGIRTVRRDSFVTVGAGGLFLRNLLLGLSNVIPLLLPLGLAASGALDGAAKARVIDLRKAGQAGGSRRDAPDLEARITRDGHDVTTGRPAESASLITAAPITHAPAAAPIAHTPAAEPIDRQPAPEPALPVVSGPGTVPVFELSDGTVIRVSGLGFIGRAPRAPESIPDAILVRVSDGTRSLSRTHASFGLDDGQVWVQDLGSANGASVRHLGGNVTELASEQPYFLVPGDTLVLGGDAEVSFGRIVDREDATEHEAAVSREAAGVRGDAGVRAAAGVREDAGAPVPADEAPLPRRMRRSEASEAVLAPQVAPAAAPVPAAPEVPAVPATIALQFQNGTTVPIRGIGYIGRAPSLPDGERADAALIAVPDGDRSVSRTHGRFGIAGDATWFEDLGSGNGSALRTGDGRSGAMTPHQRFSLVPGMVLQLGDCIIRVVSA